MNARNSFDKELERLHMDLIKMGSMAEEAIEQSVRAFSLRDNALAKEVMQGDHQIDDMEKQIETVCLSLILRQQPVAGDLRRFTLCTENDYRFGAASPTMLQTLPSCLS